MKTEQNMTMMEIMNQQEGVRLREKHGSKFRFRMHMTKSMSETPIDILCLSKRSDNILKRAGYCNIGELAESIANGKELKKIRNCGAKSVREIMEQLFLFQYYSLPENRRQAYLDEVVRINTVA